MVWTECCAGRPPQVRSTTRFLRRPLPSLFLQYLADRGNFVGNELHRTGKNTVIDSALADAADVLGCIACQ